MNQDQQVDDDLQKAIDNITNNAAPAPTPVFADPVAAPSSIPEGDTGELAEPIGPFPTPKVEVVQETEQIAPLEPMTIPDLPLPPVEPPVPTPQIVTESVEATDNIPLPPPVAPTIEEPIVTAPRPEGSTVHQIKKAALRDLVPLVNHLDITPSQKFNLYKDIFEDLKDYTVLDPAYRAATLITDENERAEALLYLVESIDNM